MASSSSSSAAAVVEKFDVFLSFRGDDTRNNFTSVLLGLLRDKSIHVFIDDDLKRGEEISPSLMKAIEESMISIIIFSERYASSRWCLEELMKIMECRKSFRQTVIPVFYKVEATHVRNQTGAFGDGFAKLVEKSKDTVQSGRWRNALTAAANISGRPLTGDLSEFVLASVTAKDVLNTLNYLSPSDSKGLVGTENKIEEILDDSKITTHDLLQDMGRAIVREESIKYPGERSRLYFHEDIYYVFEENTGTRAIEGICLDMCEGSELIDLTPDALSKMRRLRFFKLHNSYYGENNINKVNVPQGLDSISTQLKYICWHGFPLKSLPSNFHPKGLIALDMPHSNIEQLQIVDKIIVAESYAIKSSYCICFPGKEIPEWFTSQAMGTTISFQLRDEFMHPFSDFIVCVILEFQNYHNDGRGLVVGYDFTTDNDEELSHGTLKGWDYGKGPGYVDLDHIFMGHLSATRFLERHIIRSTIHFYVENVNAESIASCRVKSCGVHIPEREEAQPYGTRLKTSDFRH